MSRFLLSACYGRTTREFGALKESSADFLNMSLILRDDVDLVVTVSGTGISAPFAGGMISDERIWRAACKNRVKTIRMPLLLNGDKIPQKRPDESIEPVLSGIALEQFYSVVINMYFTL